MLTLENVSHRYDETPVLHDVSLELDDGHIGCILGPSGCGKTTLLRCIAGFERVESGEIHAGSTVLSSTSTHIAPEERRIGMVFQDYALLPHLTALKNVVFALHREPAANAEATAADFLDRVGLGKLTGRYPHELSGGQQQRVALARALAPRPQLLLMDEPFSNLDIGLRAKLGSEVRELLRELNTTALVAMHDHQDAFALADDAGVLRRGKLLQWDTAYQLYHRPADRFVADFVGRGVWLEGQVQDDNSVTTKVGTISGRMKDKLPAGTRVDVLFRPDDVVHDDDSPMQATVLAKQFKGSEFLYELCTESGVKLLSSVPSHHDHPIGEPIGICLETDHLVVFRRD
ncbi:MAG: ABC transporter ATP-binding protein [Woeseia sp.]|nr:ABC transporter ATP-binding protein [Woeseia sp.]NNE61607.1 ABC transporter ATP-binding protein [Woeseia sp.]NNL55472.1 ABC transporter ATP-binding protein [Woeseia sp.]